MEGLSPEGLASPGSHPAALIRAWGQGDGTQEAARGPRGSRWFPQETKGHRTEHMQEPQTWPEITAIASAVNQAQLQLVQNLLLLSKHFFCKTKCVHRVGRGPEGQRRLQAGGFPTVL